MSSTGRQYQFAQPASAQRAANLLGINSEELARIIFSTSSTPSNPNRTAFRTPSPTDKGLPTSTSDSTGQDCLEGLVTGLYAEVFNCVCALINKAISTYNHSVSSILVVDCPGFQNPASCGRQTGASFEDLCHNYLQERLQLLFHHTNLVAPRDK